ncbi:Protein xmas-2-like Protein [Tribolium castaneum]|uniref:Protein xmas-2-like Protein n=2 Tax=Tribolium castaneum TaxID=7070 RepID=A0A139WMB2_TRICA|nr:PREDICTED: germinal-center associated nuclear protein [Tribolium castaneum]KYB29016.1 Protein xmas-2-like Protein [Tribolium castaneum]|eukprot:XP_008195023.1 PREDICTED: germinal-center associated nuclear protein [Tribolium castaneum]
MEKIDNYIKGTCTAMCPTEEIKMREREKMLHVLEMVPGTEKTRQPKASTAHMVKSFSRSAAGKQIKPETLRPPQVLLKTVKYLLCDVINTKRLPYWHSVYDFITDRLLAVRQDLVVQNVSKAESITILQPIVRFHAYAAYRLCEEGIANFDATLNNKHFQECLKKLLYIYDSYDFLNLEIKSVCNDYFIENRPEFEALYLIFNLGNDEALTRSLTIPKKCKTNVVKDATKLSFCFKYGNFVQACRIIKNLPALLAAVASLHLGEIRRRAFNIMSTAYHSKNLAFPCEVVREVLLYGSVDELLQDCKYYGIRGDNEHLYFSKQAFDSTKAKVGNRRELFVENKKMEDKLDVIILGL